MGGTALKRSYPKPPPALAGTGEKKTNREGLVFGILVAEHGTESEIAFK